MYLKNQKMNVDDEFNLTPLEVAETADVIPLSLFTEKCKVKKGWIYCMVWRGEKIIRYSEYVLFKYFSNVPETGLIASLWPKYSVFKSTLSLKSTIDISKYNNKI